MKKWIIPLLYILLMAVIFFRREDILSWLGHRPSFLVMTLVAAFLAMFPVLPYKFVIAGIGLAYGPLAGATIAVIGSTLSGAVLYAVGAFGYKREAANLLLRYSALKRFTAYVARHPFESIALYRLLPIVPQWVINLYAGAASIPFWIYLPASVIGKTPGIFVYAYLGSSIFSRPLIAMEVLGVYLLLIGTAAWSYKRLHARRAG